MSMFVFARGMKALLCSAILVLASSAQAAEVIYDSTANYLGAQATEFREYGDEIRVSGVARVIERFEVEYAADYQGSATIPTMRFRLYLNDPNNFFKPGQVLWESEVLPIIIPTGNFGRMAFGSAAQPLMYNGQQVAIPEGFDRITFTVEFTGLTMRTTPPRDFAGLSFYGNPTIGRSADDYWRRTVNGQDWALVRNPAVSRSNFGAIFYAVPEPSTLALTSMFGIAGLWTLLRRRS